MQTSGMAVSRWERGVVQPPSNILIQLGRLAGPKHCWFFYEHAGLVRADMLQLVPGFKKQVAEERLATSVEALESAGQIALPVLPIFAAAHETPGAGTHRLSDTKPERAIFAPKEWCPNPVFTRCVYVIGESMMPTLHDGYLIAVDEAQRDISSLNGSIISAFSKETGLVVSRLKRLRNVEVLLPDNRAYEPTVFTSKWHVVGKVLWWIGGEAGLRVSAASRQGSE
jgi:hypothetical protein